MMHFYTEWLFNPYVHYTYIHVNLDFEMKEEYKQTFILGFLSVHIINSEIYIRIKLYCSFFCSVLFCFFASVNCAVPDVVNGVCCSQL